MRRGMVVVPAGTASWPAVGLLLAAGWLLAAGAPVAAGEPERVTIRGETFNIWPVDDLRARGFEVRDIPRAENAAWVYLEAADAYEELPPRLVNAFDYAVSTAWPAAQGEELEAYLALPGNRRAIERARAATGMDAYQMPYFGEPGGSILGVILPNLSPMRFLSKLMLADAMRLRAAGEYDRAIGAYLAGLRMGGHVGGGMTLIEGLVGIAVWTIADRALQDIILREPLSRDQLVALRERLDRLGHVMPTVDRGLRGERMFGPTIVDDLCSRPGRLLANLPFQSEMGDIAFLDGFDARPDDGWGRLELRVGRLLLPDRTVKRHMNDFYDKVLARADSGPHSEAAMSFDEEQYIQRSIPRWDVLSRYLLPSLARAITLGERVRADYAITRALIAVRLFMRDHDGRPPAALTAITETLPDEALADPFGEGWLRYVPTTDGFVLYSVGPNLIDDGGRSGERWDQLDMVCPYPPKAVEPFGTEGD